MSGARITIDGLWRCLCPSIDAATFTRAVSTPYRPPRRQRRRRLLPNHDNQQPKCAAAPTVRLLHTTARRLENGGGGSGSTPRDEVKDGPAPLGRIIGEGAAAAATRHGSSINDPPPGSHENRPRDEQLDDSFAPLLGVGRGTRHPASSERQDDLQDLARPGTEPPTSSIPPRSNNKNNAVRDDTAGKESLERTTPPPPLVKNPVNPENVQRILKKNFPFEVPPGVTTEDVFEALRYTRNLQRPRWKTITTKLVQHLLTSGVPPNILIYETLLMAQASTEGSADAVRSLLAEMRQKKITWSSTAYHSALRALAVHPDYLMRADVLRQMKERWIEVNPRGHQHVALGLLRDEQYELALEKLEEMINKKEPVEPWVFDIFIFVFGKLEFLDDALRIARHRQDTGSEVPVNVWYFLLDVCSRGHNHDATTYIWARTVPQGIVNPSDGVCLNVLNMAAAHGDAELATEVIQFLAARGTKLGPVHYEAVADAYCAQGNMDKAIEALCIMHDAGVEVSAASVGSLSQALRRDPSTIDAAILAMNRLRDKHQISIVIFNAVLDALARSDAPSAEDAYARALGLYRRVREFVPAGPDRETFRKLLWRCTNPDLAQFLVGEMVHFGVRQNLVIKELLFHVQVSHDGPAHRAKWYFYKIAPHYHRKETASSSSSLSSPPPSPRKWRRFMDLSVRLVRRLIGERDPEAWRILAYCQSNGLDEATTRALREEVEGGKIAMRQEEEEEEEEDDDKRVASEEASGGGGGGGDNAVATRWGSEEEAEEDGRRGSKGEEEEEEDVIRRRFSDGRRRRN